MRSGVAHHSLQALLLVGGQLGAWPDRKVVIVHHLQHRYDLDRPR
jgi:hypothetical protein